MSKRRRIVVTSVLILLLIAALANFLFIRRLSSDVTASYETSENPARDSQGGPSAAGGGRRPLRAAGPRVANPAEFPGWYGRASLSRSASGYDLVIEAIQRGSQNYAALDAIEAELRQAGHGTHGTTLILKNAGAGKFFSHIDALGSGEWEVRVRMHRGSTTLEFTQKFTAD